MTVTDRKPTAVGEAECIGAVDLDGEGWTAFARPAAGGCDGAPWLAGAVVHAVRHSASAVSPPAGRRVNIKMRTNFVSAGLLPRPGGSLYDGCPVTLRQGRLPVRVSANAAAVALAAGVVPRNVSS